MSFLLRESGIPFDRTFFNVTLESVLGTVQGTGPKRLILFLTDGSTLDVCKIEDMTEGYLVVRAYRGEEQSCDVKVNLIPYSLIYRIEVGPAGGDDKRLGFTWTRPAKSTGTRVRR